MAVFHGLVTFLHTDAAVLIRVYFYQTSKLHTEMQKESKSFAGLQDMATIRDMLSHFKFQYNSHPVEKFVHFSYIVVQCSL